MLPIGVILRHFETLCEPKFNCISSKFFYDYSKLCLSPNSIASHRNSSKRISNVVSAQIQLHLIGNILRQFQILSWPKFNCISSEFFWDNSKFCLSQISIAPHRNYSETIPNCVSAKIQLLLIAFIIYSKTIPNCVLDKTQSHLIGVLLRHFQILSQQKFNCFPSELFYDISKLCVSQNSIASHRNFSTTIPNFVLAQIQLHLIEILLREFQMLSQPKFNCISSEIF